MKYEIIEFEDGMSVLEYKEEIHLLILDIEMPAMLDEAVEILCRAVIIDGIDSRDIPFIKTIHMYSNLICLDGSNYLVRQSMRELEELLYKEFVRKIVERGKQRE